MHNAYKAAYLSTFSRLLDIVKDAHLDANGLSEGSIRTVIDESIPLPNKRDGVIIAYLADGLTHAEIGKKINLSGRTIDTRVYQLMVRYGAKRSVQLISIFFRNGWLK